MANYKGACGTKDAQVADFKRRVHIWVKIKNKGQCPIKVRFFKTSIVWVPAPPGVPWPPAIPVVEYRRQLTKTVPPGKKASPDRDEVNRVTISCDDGEEEQKKKRPKICRFTYSIRAD